MSGVTWRYDGDEGYWECVKCGLQWVLNDGSPQENGINYCPKCGCPIVEFEYPYEEG